MSKDSKNPYLSGEQPKDTIDYRMILEEQRAKREREALMPGRQSMAINREALGLPPLDTQQNGPKESRFKFDLQKDVLQNVDLKNLGTGEDRYSANYRPQKENIGSKSMYDALAQTKDVTPEEVLALFGVDEARRSPERKAPIEKPARSVDERRAELDSMLPDQGKITLDSIMKERQKNNLPMPSLIAEEIDHAEEEPLPEIEMIDVVTPLRENVDLPGFEFRRRYLHNGLEPQEELPPQREGFEGGGGRLPEFESETRNWSERASDELFAPIEPKKTVIYPMQEKPEEVVRAPRHASARHKTLSETRAEQPKELTRQEIIAQSHAVRRKDRAKRRTSIGGYIQNPVPDMMDAQRAYEAGRNNAAFLAEQEAELARKHAEIAKAMDIMEGINSQQQPPEQPAAFDGFGGLDEMTSISPSFAVPVDIPDRPQSRGEQSGTQSKKSMFSYLFNDDEPLPDTFSDYSKYAQQQPPQDPNAAPSYGYLYVNDDEIKRHASIAEESFTMEDEPADDSYSYTPRTARPAVQASRPAAQPKPQPQPQQPQQPSGVKKSDLQLDFDIPLDKQVLDAPNMKPKDFSEFIDNQDDEPDFSDFNSFDDDDFDLDSFHSNGGNNGNISVEPPAETASEDITELSVPVTSESPSENLWDEIAKERKGGSGEIRKAIVEFTGEMVERGSDAAAKFIDNIENRIIEHRLTADIPTKSSEDEQEEAAPEQETSYSEYTDQSQAQEIKDDMLNKLGELVFRGAANLAFFLILLTMELLPAFGVNLPYISLNASPTSYYLITLLLTVFTVVTNYIVPYHSIKSLLAKHFDGSFGFVAASAAALLQNTCMLLGGSLRSYSVMLAFAYLVNTVGEFINISRIGRNFAFVSSKTPKGAVMLADNNIVPDENAARGNAEPVAAYSIKTKFLSDYLSFAYEEDPGEIESSRIAPFLAAASVAVGFLAMIISGNIFTGLSAMTASCMIAIPVTRLICVNLPLFMKLGELKRFGTMLSGWAAVDEFGDVGMLSVDDKLLFPSSCVSVDSIRIFDQSRKAVAVKTTAAVLNSFGGVLADKFTELIGSEVNELPLVTDLEYIEDIGYSGKLDGDNVVLGTIEILKRFDINLPELDYESLFRNTNSAMLYLAIGGRLSAMFIIVYRSDKKTASALKELDDAGIKLSIKTFDPTINGKRIAAKFGVSEDFATVVNDYFDDSSSVYNVTCSRAPAVIGTNRTLAGAAKGIATAVTIKNSIALAVILQTIGSFLGFLLVAIFACSGISTMISPLKLIAYMLFWIAAVVIAPMAGNTGIKNRDKKTKNKNRRKKR